MAQEIGVFFCPKGYRRHKHQWVKSKLILVQDKQNLRATCPQGKLEYNLFSSPVESGYGVIPVSPCCPLPISPLSPGSPF